METTVFIQAQPKLDMWKLLFKIKIDKMPELIHHLYVWSL